MLDRRPELVGNVGSIADEENTIAPKLFDPEALRDDWAWDISLLWAAMERHVPLINVRIGLLEDRQRDGAHNALIASEILDFFLAQHRSQIESERGSPS